ncbi:hypothetical protein AURDEDRAFT_178102 [Auricularia subglabra TFB-10046 SS5]|uniref:Uncharacterized protein n=1 Tax=Auricularia subglabra (strain TFB-10046 / SS5) TaxID=717982 RepID=J0L8V3_AURST|nr:hypothetical protein AURDEDRAFT_178102 [Auricularia subglabra TFB-10046 SS5]
MVGDAAFQRSLGMRMIEPMPLGAVDSDGLTELSPELVRIVELAFLFKEQQNELAAASTVAATSANGAGASGSQRKLGGAKALEEAEALWLQYFAELPDHYDGTRWIALCNRSFVPPRPPENPSLGATLGYDGRYGRHEEHHAPQMVQMERPHMAFIPMLARLPEEEAWVQTKVDGWYYKVHGDPSLDFAWFTQFDWKRDFDSPGPGQCRLSRTLAKKVEQTIDGTILQWERSKYLRKMMEFHMASRQAEESAGDRLEMPATVFWSTYSPVGMYTKLLDTGRFLTSCSGSSWEMRCAMAWFQRAVLEIRGWLVFCKKLEGNAWFRPPRDTPESLEGAKLNHPAMFCRGVFVDSTAAYKLSSNELKCAGSGASPVWDANAVVRAYAQYGAPVWLLIPYSQDRMDRLNEDCARGRRYRAELVGFFESEVPKRRRACDEMVREPRGEMESHAYMGAAEAYERKERLGKATFIAPGRYLGADGQLMDSGGRPTKQLPPISTTVQPGGTLHGGVPNRSESRDRSPSPSFVYGFDGAEPSLPEPAPEYGQQASSTGRLKRPAAAVEGLAKKQGKKKAKKQGEKLGPVVSEAVEAISAEDAEKTKPVLADQDVMRFNDKTVHSRPLTPESVPSWFPSLFAPATRGALSVETERNRLIERYEHSKFAPPALSARQELHSRVPWATFLLAAERHNAKKFLQRWDTVRVYALHSVNIDPAEGGYSGKRWRTLMKGFVTDDEALEAIEQLGMESAFNGEDEAETLRTMGATSLALFVESLQANTRGEKWIWSNLVDRLKSAGTTATLCTMPRDDLDPEQWLAHPAAAALVWDLEEHSFRLGVLGFDMLLRRTHPDYAPLVEHEASVRYDRVVRCWGSGAGGLIVSDENWLCSEDMMRRGLALSEFAKLMLSWPNTEDMLECWSPYLLTSDRKIADFEESNDTLAPPTEGEEFEKLEHAVWKCYSQVYYDYYQRFPPVPFLKPNFEPSTL